MFKCFWDEYVFKNSILTWLYLLTYALKADLWTADFSPIDIASYLYLLSNVSLLHVVGNDIQKKRIKKKIKSFHSRYLQAIRIKSFQF